MLIEQTVDKLNALKLGAMADAFQKQLDTDQAAALSFEERLGLLVDTEWTAREQRKLRPAPPHGQAALPRRRSRPSTSPTRAGSIASRSSRSAPARGSLSATT